MMMTTGTVVYGKIIVAGEPLSEGSTVTVFARGEAEDRGFVLSPEEETALLASIHEADRGDLVSGDEILRELGSHD